MTDFTEKERAILVWGLEVLRLERSVTDDAEMIVTDLEKRLLVGSDLTTIALGICRQMHPCPCSEPCGWCTAEADIEIAAREDDRPGRVWPMDAEQ